MVLWQSYFRGHKPCLYIPDLTTNISNVPQEIVPWGFGGEVSLEPFSTCACDCGMLIGYLGRYCAWYRHDQYMYARRGLTCHNHNCIDHMIEWNHHGMKPTILCTYINLLQKQQASRIGGIQQGTFLLGNQQWEKYICTLKGTLRSNLPFE